LVRRRAEGKGGRDEIVLWFDLNGNWMQKSKEIRVWGLRSWWK
jgi:hypothetical protein